MKAVLIEHKIILRRCFFYKMGNQIMLLYQCCDVGRIGCHQHGIKGTYYLKTGKILEPNPLVTSPPKKVDFDTPDGPLPLIFF